MRKVLLLAGVSLAVAVLLVWSWRAFGPRSVWFAFLVVWLPMTWLGTMSRAVRPRLPERYHALRPFELDGRVYERLGVLVAKRVLRRGPLAAFNRDLHLPAERTPESLRRLDRRMRDAEAAHAILLVVTLAIVVHAAVRGWWGAAVWTLVFDIVMNGYPVMLQRYNRARLQRRFAVAPQS